MKAKLLAFHLYRERTNNAKRQFNDAVALPDHDLLISSDVIRFRAIFFVVSSIPSFSNHRQ